LCLDTPTPEEIVLSHEGTPLLVVEPGLAERVSDAALDGPAWTVDGLGTLGGDGPQASRLYNPSAAPPQVLAQRLSD